MSSSKKNTRKINIENEIKEYEKAINGCNIRNKELDSEIDDLKTTLELNKNICFKYLEEIFGKEDQEIINMLKEQEHCLKENEKLIEKNSEEESKVILLNEGIRIAPNEIKKEIEKAEVQNDKLQNEIIKKENEIKKLLLVKERIREKYMFNSVNNQIYILDPTSSNIELNNEILSNKIIIKNVMKMSHKYKLKNEEVSKEIADLQYKLNDTVIPDNVPKLNIFNRPNKSGSVSLKNIKPKHFINEVKTVVVKKNDIYNESYDDQECISFQSVDNDSSDVDVQQDNASDSSEFESSNEDENISNKNVIKNKKKRLEVLSKEYNKLKQQNDELESNIQKQKNTYLQLMSKLNKLQVNQNKNKNNVLNPSLPSTEEKTEDKK